VRKDDLTLFFEKKNIKKPDNQGECRVSLNILKDCGYNHGLCRLLNSDKDTGIIGDKKDLERRQLLFGKHSIALPKIQTFETLLARQFEDSNVIFLIWTATIYLGFSVFSPSATAYIESLTIYTGLLFAALISALCDWIKERQYLKLKDEINNQMVTVYRGAYGTCLSIKIRDLVVGDIVDIQQGDRVPADCILIEEMNITVDQSMYNPQESNVAKETSRYMGPEAQEVDNHEDHPDPFLFSDSKVMTGQGKAVVCCVGDQTLLARNRKPKDLVIEE
jgi:magnesium-transporting ATPase (P-type)